STSTLFIPSLLSFLSLLPPPPTSPLFPYTTLFRSHPPEIPDSNLPVPPSSYQRAALHLFQLSLNPHFLPGSQLVQFPVQNVPFQWPPMRAGDFHMKTHPIPHV